MPMTEAPSMIGRPGYVTQPQYDFICDLLDSRRLTANPKFFDIVNAMDHEEFTAYVQHLKDVTMTRITRTAASDLITTLKALPKNEDSPLPTSTSRNWDDEPWRPSNIANTGEEPMFCMMPKGGDGTILVPRGSYAIDTINGTNEVMFVSVWFSKTGDRWSVKRYESDALVKVPRAQQYSILERIASDPVAAAELYGLEIGKCGICHRKLTNDISRARGIGPICAQRWGW